MSEQVGAVLLRRGHRLVTAESCTGGWVAQAVTAVPGSSHWFDRGFITYSNEAKCDMLGVSAATLDRFGAVSEETVREMARGALSQSAAQCALAVSGIAGPGGGAPEKPVGTVYFAWEVKGGLCQVMKARLSGDRRSVREQAVKLALEGVIDVYR